MNVLVIRFSSIGDVVLTLPAIKASLKQNPELKITFLTKSFFEPLFQNTERLQFEGINLNDYKGINGLLKLCNLLYSKHPKFDAVIDLHDSLRSKIIRSYFYFKKSRISILDKGRKAKKILTRKKNKILTPLKHHTERYADVFRNIGIPVLLDQNTAGLIQLSSLGIRNAENFLENYNDKKRIGIAPFTSSTLKEWPIEKIDHLIGETIKVENETTFIIFGGKNDVPKIQFLLQKYSNNAISAIELKGGLQTELAIIKNLDLMLSMDSGNMHLASMLGTKTKAIFGPTHPYLGFSPYLQPNSIIQIEDLDCRPCTVFGNKTCWRKDHACMQNLQISTKDLEIN